MGRLLRQPNDRAAKVAAFPLTALILVALIACQGPAGPAGADGKKGDAGTPGTAGTDGTAGTPGMDAPPGLDATKIPVQFFKGVTATAQSANEVIMLDLEDLNGADADGNPMAFTGGTPPLMYRISSAVNVPTGVTYMLYAAEDEERKTMLRVTLDSAVVNTADHFEDMSILIEATDSDGAGDVAYVHVRVNEPPAPYGPDTSGASTLGTPGTLALTVGTQAEASPAAPAATVLAAGEPDYFLADQTAETSSNAIVCAMLNSCTITVMASDENLRDMLTWKYDVQGAAKDSITVMAANGDGRLEGKVTITGNPSASGGDATVRVWAEDEAGSPMKDENGNYQEDATTGGSDDGIDQTKFPATVYIITVTVDEQPRMSAAAIGSVSMKVSDEPKVIGHVFDDDDFPADAATRQAMTFKPTIAEQGDDAVAEALQGAGDNSSTPNRMPILVNGLNRGTVTLTLKTTELAASDQPTQYAEHTIAVTVTP